MGEPRIPRTEAGRALVQWGSRLGLDMRDDALAIEQEAAALDVERLTELVKRHGLSQMLNEQHPAFLPLRDLLSGALRGFDAEYARLQEAARATT
jgi:hypothetical protein